MYTNEEMLASIKKVEANRAANAAYEPARMTAEQKDEVLKTYHPDYIESQFEDLKIGPNKGDKVPKELGALLQGHSRIKAAEIDLSHPDYDADVLIIGAGGAGCSAALEAQAQELEERYPTCAVHVYCADLVETAQIQAAAEAICQDGFGVDVLVNIAGMNFLEKAVDVKEEVWDYLMDLNLKGSFFLTQQVAQDSLLDRGGNVIFIASQHAVVGNQMRAAYCASKSGLLGLMRVLALEWAAFGVRVNAVSPTYILNDKNRDVLRNANYKRKYLQRIPLKRYAQPEDVANAILFLSSDQASMITGHNLMVDGGYTAV